MAGAQSRSDKKGGRNDGLLSDNVYFHKAPGRGIIAIFGNGRNTRRKVLDPADPVMD